MTHPFGVQAAATTPNPAVLRRGPAVTAGILAVVGGIGSIVTALWWIYTMLAHWDEYFSTQWWYLFAESFAVACAVGLLVGALLMFLPSSGVRAAASFILLAALTAGLQPDVWAFHDDSPTTRAMSYVSLLTFLVAGAAAITAILSLPGAPRAPLASRGQQPAGWYPDGVTGQLRWWDGAQWTPNVKSP